MKNLSLSLLLVLSFVCFQEIVHASFVRQAPSIQVPKSLNPEAKPFVFQGFSSPSPRKHPGDLGPALASQLRKVEKWGTEEKTVYKTLDDACRATPLQDRDAKYEAVVDSAEYLHNLDGVQQRLQRIAAENRVETSGQSYSQARIIVPVSDNCPKSIIPFLATAVESSVEATAIPTTDPKELRKAAKKARLAQEKEIAHLKIEHKQAFLPAAQQAAKIARKINAPIGVPVITSAQASAVLAPINSLPASLAAVVTAQSASLESEADESPVVTIVSILKKKKKKPAGASSSFGVPVVKLMSKKEVREAHLLEQAINQAELDRNRLEVAEQLSKAKKLEEEIAEGLTKLEQKKEEARKKIAARVQAINTLGQILAGVNDNSTPIIESAKRAEEFMKQGDASGFNSLQEMFQNPGIQREYLKFPLNLHKKIAAYPGELSGPDEITVKAFMRAFSPFNLYPEKLTR